MNRKDVQMFCDCKKAEGDLERRGLEGEAKLLIKTGKSIISNGITMT